MFRSTRPLIGTPREPQKGAQAFEFTPIGDENKHGSYTKATTGKKGATDIHNLIYNNGSRKPLHNSPLENKLRGGSSFMDESEYDTLNYSASKQPQHQASVSPATNVFNNNPHQELLNNGSNPVRQQQEDLSRLTSENYNLKVKIASLTKYLNAVTNQEQQYIYEENSRLQEQLILLREEVSQLNRELSIKEQQSQPAHPKSDNSEKYKDEIGRLRENIHDLEMSLQEKEQMRETIKDLQDLNTQLQDEVEHQSQKSRLSSPVSKQHIANLHQELEEANGLIEDKNFELRQKDDELDEKDDLIENLQAQVRQLQQSSHRDGVAESQVDELKLLLKDKDEQLAQQKREVKSLEKEVEYLKESIMKANDEAEELAQSLEAAERKLNKFQDDMLNRSTGERSTAEIERLHSINADLESQIESLHAKFKESKSIISDQKQIIDELSQSGDAADELKKEKEHLKIKIEQLQRENERTYKAYQDLKKMHQQNKAKRTDNEDLWKSEVELLTDKVKDLNVENEKLYEDLEKEKRTKALDQDSYAKLELKSLTSKCNELQLELSDKERSLERLTSQYQKELARCDNIIEQKEKELKVTKDELRSLKMSTLQQLDDEKIELIKVKGSKESQIKLLQIELENIKEQHQMEVTSLKKLIERLKKTTATTDEPLISSQVADQSRELLQKITEKNSRIKYLTEKLTEALLTLKETQSKVTKLESYKEDLREENYNLEAKLEDMSGKLYKLKRDMKDMVPTKQELEELSDLKLELKLRQRDDKESKTLVRQLSEKCNSLDEEKELVQRRFEKLVEKYRQLQSTVSLASTGSSRELTTTQNKLDYYKMKHTKAIYQIKDLKFMNNFMKKSIQATNTSLKKDIKKLQDVGIYPDYELISRKKPTLKVLLKFVLAAVRIKRKTEFSTVRNQRIELLEMKALV